MEKCQEEKQKHDKKTMRMLEKQEQERLSTVYTVNKYEI